jgi:hypothetical protein
MSRAPRRVARTATTPDEIQDQEVQRAWRELSAYFKGRRTEREARAALKIIKAFIRERERTDPSGRRPLPGLRSPSPHAKRPRAKARPVAPKRRRRAGRVSAAVPAEHEAAPMVVQPT